MKVSAFICISALEEERRGGGGKEASMCVFEQWRRSTGLKKVSERGEAR